MKASSTNPIPKYRRQKRASGEDTAFVEIDGTRRYLGPFASPESREKYHRLLAEHSAGTMTVEPSADITINEIVAAHWRHSKLYYAKSPTELDRIKTVGRIICRLYGSSAADKFGPVALKACRQALIDAGNCRRQVNQQTCRMRRLFKWAVSEELVPASLCHGLTALSGLRFGRTTARESEPVRPVPDEYVDAIRPFVSRQVWAMIELQRLTGMRGGEVTAMRGRDIDMTGKLWTYRPDQHKSKHRGHTRVVELGPKAQGVVRPFLRTEVDAYLFSPADATKERHAAAETHRRARQAPNTRKTTREVGDHYTSNSYRQAVQRACDLAFPPPSRLKGTELAQWRKDHRWHPHQLRHLAATRFRKEYGIETARILLGHKSAIVTEIYAEVDRAKAQEIVAKIG